MKVNKNQRVAVLVDVQNLYYSAKGIHNSKVNFEAVLKECVKGRILIRAIAYAVRAEEIKEQSFFDALERIGYEVKAKDLQVFAGGGKKADWDVGIAMDAIEIAPKMDVIVIVSGDGDFIPLVQHLRRALGCKVEGAAFGKSTSSKLKEELGEFLDLDIGKKFLRGKIMSGKKPTKSVPKKSGSKKENKSSVKKAVKVKSA